MLRRLSFVALFVALATSAIAEEKPDARDEPKRPGLAIGDAAPPLAPTKWLQGEKVTSFESGRVYVVEFWATWCGPCIVMMPHVSHLQDQYRDQGVTIVGFTAKDNNNSLEKVTEFVEQRGMRLHYTLAYADNRDTYDAYMKAAKQSGIPCCFVIDKAGKIAFIGHPMLLDDVLPPVIAGTWKGQADADEVAKGQTEFREAATLINKEPEAALKALTEFQAKRPNLAKSCFYCTAKLTVLLKLEKFDEAKTEAQELVEFATRNEDGAILGRVAGTLVGSGVRSNKDLQTLAVSAAEASVKLQGDKDVASLLTLADAYFAAGDRSKAKATGAKAVEVAEPRLKQLVESRVKRYDGDSDN